MLRKILNASRLQEEVSRRLHKLQEVIDDGVKFTVPRPQLQSADRTGCNWTMKHFGNAAGFESAIADVLAKVQAECNLAVDDEEAAARTGDPFGGSKPADSANPFGNAAGPVKTTNPFGGSDDASACAPKRTGNPFDND